MRKMFNHTGLMETRIYQFVFIPRIKSWDGVVAFTTSMKLEELCITCMSRVGRTPNMPLTACAKNPLLDLKPQI